MPQKPPIGFSTGAIARGDVRRALDLLVPLELPVIELSALRVIELEPLVRCIEELDLAGFRYISVHVPSRLESMSEAEAVSLLQVLPPEWPLITHPDMLSQWPVWESLGSRLCIENMDLRKRTGRTVEELEPFFVRFPEARFCLDAGHAFQVNATGELALDLARSFRGRLVQVHLSLVDGEGGHRSLEAVPEWWKTILQELPPGVPIVIESPVAETEIAHELQLARDLFSSR